MLRKPAVASTLGIAASVAIILSAMSWFGGGRTVEAAVILERLNTQIQDVSLLEIELRDVAIEGVTASGLIQLCDDGVAGDIRFAVSEETAGHAVRADLSLALTPDQGWVMIRELGVDSPDVAPILAFLLPAGTHTLVRLPVEELDDFAEFQTGFRTALEQLQSAQVREAMAAIIESHRDVGATLRRLDGRTIELSLPLGDDEAVGALIEKVVTTIERGDAHNTASPPGPGAGGRGVDVNLSEEGIDLSRAEMLIRYDTVAERVQSVAVEGFGSNNGSIAVRLLDGHLDPALLDAERQRTPQTRDFDLGALMNAFNSGGKGRGAE